MRLQAERFRKPRAALLCIVESLGSRVQAMLPEMKTLLEQGPLDPASASHLVRWIQVFRYTADVLEPPVKAALSEGNSQNKEDEREVLHDARSCAGC